MAREVHSRDLTDISIKFWVEMFFDSQCVQLTMYHTDWRGWTETWSTAAEPGRLMTRDVHSRNRVPSGYVRLKQKSP